MVLGATRTSNPLSRSAKPGGGSIPLAPSRLSQRKNVISYVNSSQVKAHVSGCVWGLVRDGIILKKGQKIGDIDPRGKRELCFEIAAEARMIAHGALEAIITFQSR